MESFRTFILQHPNAIAPAIFFALVAALLLLCYTELGFVSKQMHRAALGTTLTFFSILLGVALAIAILIFYREGDKFFGQSDFGYDLIVGPKGDELQLVLNTTYQIGTSQGNIPYSTYEELDRNRQFVRWAIPYAVGDEYQGYRIVGTSERILPTDSTGKPHEAQGKVFQYRKERPYQLAQGRNFHPEKFEAVVGSDVAEKAGLRLGSTFKARHGAGAKAATEDVHNETWTVVGVLQTTHTASDRIIYIPLTSFYAIPDHGKALEQMSSFEEAYKAMKGGQPPAPAPQTQPSTSPATKPDHDEHDHDADEDHDKEEDHAGHHHEHTYHMQGDRIHLDLPKDKWKLSAVLVQTRGGYQMMSLEWGFRNRPDAMAVNPAKAMREFFATFLTPFTRLLLTIAVLVNVVAAVSVLVSIYNSVINRLREIAILRALGATRARILLVICLEAGLLGLLGALAGLLVGHLLGLGVSAYMEQKFGQGINWLAINWLEWVYLAGIALLAVLAGLVPALKAYQTPVATNLVAG